MIVENTPKWENLQVQLSLFGVFYSRFHVYVGVFYLLKELGCQPQLGIWLIRDGRPFPGSGCHDCQ